MTANNGWINNISTQTCLETPSLSNTSFETEVQKCGLDMKKRSDIGTDV